MTGIAPPAAGTTEERLDAAAGDRFARIPASLAETAWNAAELPEEYLPVLAWALSLDEWNPGWDVLTKRTALNSAAAAHRVKGTAAGVKGVLDRIGAEYDYVERLNGAPFTARVTIYNSGSLQVSDAASVGHLVNAFKRQSVVMDVVLESGLRGEIAFGGGLGSVVVANFELEYTP